MSQLKNYESKNTSAIKNSTLNSVSNSNLSNSIKNTPENSVLKESKNRIEDDLIGNKNDAFATNLQKFK